MILAVVEDLFFGSKIRETATLCGVEVAFAATEEAALSRVGEALSLILVDLNLKRLSPLGLIGTLKRHPQLKNTTVVGFLSHVQTELKLEAQRAGCDLVLPRSLFSQNLPEILKRYSEAR